MASSKGPVWPRQHQFPATIFTFLKGFSPMSRFTLRQKFLFGMAAVLVVSLLVLLGGRFLSKAARFHHLERALRC